MSQLKIAHSDPDFVVIDKPAGFHVHPPEDPTLRIGKRENAMALLRDQLGTKVYPVHRLDRATSGLVIYALNPEAASGLARQFQERRVTKIYSAICRGWPKSDRFVIDSPLVNSLDLPGPELEARTEVEVAYRGSFARAMGKFPEARFSLLWVKPETGRMHQIRRHLRRESHPLLGDSIHGDGAYNRWIRELFGRNVLFLKAYELHFAHPKSGERIAVRSSFGPNWHKLFQVSGVCLWR